jgi:hypothetical protein
MHRLRSRSAIHRFRSAALLVVAKCVFWPIAAILLVYAVLVHDNELIIAAMGAVFLTVVVTVLQWVIALRTNCPLCMTPVLANKSCTKHRHARSFLGSHRLRVALSIMFTNTFRCPFCHEPTALEVRERGLAYRKSKG